MDFKADSKVEIMERGEWIGPFTVTGRTGRTADHLVLVGPTGNVFEHCADDYNTRAEPVTTTLQLIDDEIFICTDCYMDHHEGRAMKDNSAVTWTDNNSDPEDPEDPEETRTIDFSAMRCGCCGTTLAGARYRMAVWED